MCTVRIPVTMFRFKQTVFWCTYYQKRRKINNFGTLLSVTLAFLPLKQFQCRPVTFLCEKPQPLCSCTKFCRIKISETEVTVSLIEANCDFIHFWYNFIYTWKCKFVLVNAMKANRGSRGIRPLIVSLCTRCKCSASRAGSFTPGKEHRYPSKRRVGGPQSPSERLENWKIFYLIQLLILLRILHCEKWSLYIYGDTGC